MGQMLQEMPKRDGGQAMKLKARSHDVTEVHPSLKEIGIEKMQSHRYQQIASTAVVYSQLIDGLLDENTLIA